MKNLILILATILSSNAGTFSQEANSSRKWYLSENIPPENFNQELRFEVRGRYTRPVKQIKLNEAKFLRDFIDGYPTNWINDYSSVEILATCNGNPKKSTSLNDVLNTEQKNILRSVDQATTITINVKYKYKNSVTGIPADFTMKVSMMVIPEIEAEYTGGYQKMTNYFKENVINKIPDSTRRKLQYGVVIFTINEEGEITNVNISEKTGDIKTDKLILDAITNMPKWKPAVNSKGFKVKQEFEFSVGSSGC